jgi:predicted transposase YbfD/YdcC
MQSTALATLFDEPSAAERARLLEQAKLASLPELFVVLPDPRSRHGQRYTLSFLLTCLVAALLCNCNSMDAVSQWCRDHRALLEQVFGPLRFLSPSGSLFRRLLPRLSVGQIEGVISAWVIATRPQPDTEPVALDGKTLRRAADASDPKPHLLSVATQTSREVLAQVRVADKTNEIPVALTLLPQLPLRDRVVSADALHGHAAFAQAVLDAGADYLIAIKENEPHAYAALQQYFADPSAVTSSAKSRDRQRGRIEQRTLRASVEMNAYLATFPQLGQVLEVTRVVQERGETHQEIRYYLTSCAPARADAARLLGLVRGHWGIESGHWIRDEVFGEDRSQLRTGNGPQIVAALRNLVVTLIRRTGTSAITAARRHFASCPEEAFAVLQCPAL